MDLAAAATNIQLLKASQASAPSQEELLSSLVAAQSAMLSLSAGLPAANAANASKLLKPVAKRAQHGEVNRQDSDDSVFTVLANASAAVPASPAAPPPAPGASIPPQALLNLMNFSQSFQRPSLPQEVCKGAPQMLALLPSTVLWPAHMQQLLAAQAQCTMFQAMCQNVGGLYNQEAARGPEAPVGSNSDDQTSKDLTGKKRTQRETAESHDKRRRKHSPEKPYKPKTFLTSVYRGVSQHRLTGRWEASIWVDKKQVYLGGYDKEEKAARAYDIVALHSKGDGARLNLGRSRYEEKEVQEITAMAFHDLVAKLRRESSAFSRGKSKYRGVSGHKVATSFQRPWEARIGRFSGKKNVFLGLFESEEEAARQYDRALIISKGLNAKTNFDIKEYEEEAHKLHEERRANPSVAKAEALVQNIKDEFSTPGRGRPKPAASARSIPNLKEMLYDMFIFGEFSKKTGAGAQK